MAKNQQRNSPHHKIIPQNGRSIVFLTVCTKGKTPWLANNTVHNLLVELWKCSTTWNVGFYLIMPDHIHLFAESNDEQGELSAWVAWWKAKSALEIANPLHRWQRDYWDTTVRSAEHYYEKQRYVLENPVRKGFVSSASYWKFQGEISDIIWF